MYDLTKFLPTSGFFAVQGIDRAAKRSRGTEFLNAATETTPDYIEAAVERLKARGATDFYFSHASFTWPDGAPRSRAASFATSFRTYAIDIDCHGKPGEYPNPDAAYNDVMEKLEVYGLEPNIVIGSGRGVTLCWTFTNAINTGRWQEFSVEMWSLIQHLGIKADSSCHGDRARVWRIPGSRNSASGTVSEVWDDLEPLNFRKTHKQLLRTIDEQSVPLLVTERHASVTTGSDGDGSVYNCEENSAGLRWLLRSVPCTFSRIDLSKHRLSEKEGYALWRNIVWAIKRTGLPDAWEIAQDWALQSDALDAHDDLHQSLSDTWDWDKEDRPDAIGPGTLVAVAKEFAPKLKLRKIEAFHFYTEAEIKERRELAEQRRAVRFCDPFEHSLAMLDEDPDPVPGVASEYDDVMDGLCQPDFPVDPDEDTDCELWPDLIILDFIDDYIEKARLYDAGIVSASAEAGEDGALTTDSGRLVGLQGETASAPPGEFGSPLHPLPDKFVHRRDENGHLTGVWKLVKKDTGDEDAGDEFVQVCTEALELLDTETFVGDNGPMFRYVVRRYDTLTDVPYAPFSFPAAQVSAPSDLSKTLSQHGVILGDHAKAPQLMSQYLRNLIDQRRRKYEDTPVAVQCGWEERTGRFILGRTMVTRKGKIVPSRLEHGTAQAVDGYGEAARPYDVVTLSGQKVHMDANAIMDVQRQIIETYAPEHAKPGRAIISLAGGSILSRLTKRSVGVVYTHSSRSGTGKSGAHWAALGLFGDPMRMLKNADATIAGIQSLQQAACDLPVYLDEVSIKPVKGRNGSSLDIATWVIQSSNGTGKIRASRSGNGLVSGLRKWYAPVFMSSNGAAETLVPEEFASAEGAFARILSIDASDMRMREEGLHHIGHQSIDAAIKSNYGYVGAMFVKDVVQNPAKYVAEVDAVYEALMQKSRVAGMEHLHRITNNMVACATVFFHWMQANGFAQEWDTAETEAYFASLVRANEDTIAAMPSNDVDAMLDRFRTKYASAMVVCRTGSQPTHYPDINRMPAIAVRIGEDKAFLSITRLRSFCKEAGLDTKTVIDQLQARYNAVKLPDRMNLAAGIPNTPRQMSTVLVVPANCIMSEDEKVPSSVYDGEANVFNLPLKK